MTNHNRSASSCAVENDRDGIRLTLTFMHITEYSDAHAAILGSPGLFRIDMRNPKDGGTCGGSRLVFTLDAEFAGAAAEQLEAFRIRGQIEYVNGSRHRCESIADALGLARHHA